MKTVRWILFLLMVLLGAAGAAAYGWLVHPVQARNSQLSDLRADYKADYVLMVAEVYKTDANMEQALGYLLRLNDKDPLVPVRNAIKAATKLEYSLPELDALADLERAVFNAVAAGGGN